MVHDLSMVRGGRTVGNAQEAGTLLDTIEPVADFSNATLALLSRRIADSVGYEHLVYREVELDEVWRLLEASIAEARRTDALSAQIERLERLRDGVVEAHDIVSDSSATQQAAARLRAELE